MTVPTATYRLQFRNGMDFDRAAEIAPYLGRLGISHLYASPIFRAVTGSTHGYDVTDPNEIDPVLGGREGFARLGKALRKAGLGLILDIVPNHMAASLENSWWRSVVEWGEESRFARHFDIDWSRKLTLPILGRPLEEALSAGELALRLDPESGGLALGHFDNLLPLHPSTWPDALAGADDDPLAAALAQAAREARPQAEGEFHARLRHLRDDAAGRRGLEGRLGALSAERSRLSRIHALQPWRLIHWKDARRDLSYRRFFEIAGLVGLRVEDPAVFDDAHRLVLDLVRSGEVDGLRIDHVDGLADPKAYLERLRQAAGEDTYIVVEKILERDERLPAAWPVAGTTGYEFIDALSALLVEPAGAERLAARYAEVSGVSDPELLRDEAKQLMVSRNFAGERAAIARMVSELAGNLGIGLDEGAGDWALSRLVTALPVYRTYGTAEGMPQDDRRLLAHAASEVRADADGGALDTVLRILAGEVPPRHAAGAARIRTRFQQLTGPVMAKAVEDTFFFRHNAFVALNEVGGDPLRIDGSVERFHHAMRERSRIQPHGLSATATHDTKRGEDARARLYALSEAPQHWSEAVQRWREMHAGAVRQLDGGPAPEPETEWMLYQALAGIWPADDAVPQAAGLKRRFTGFVEKALREAKLRTSWTDVDERYEAAVKGYAERLLSPDNGVFQADFSAVLRPFVRAGLINGITQTLVKLTAPGVPDIYQGCERLDLSLTDPDNRRRVDFDGLARGLEQAAPLPVTAEALWSGRFKQHLVGRCLDLRRRSPSLFGEGDYVPLETTGSMRDNVLAFMRRHGGEVALAVAPRLVLSLPAGSEAFFDPDAWEDTAIILPEDVAGCALRDVLTGCRVEPAPQLPVRKLLGHAPVALLCRDMAEGA